MPLRAFPTAQVNPVPAGPTGFLLVCFFQTSIRMAGTAEASGTLRGPDNVPLVSRTSPREIMTVPFYRRGTSQQLPVVSACLAPVIELFFHFCAHCSTSCELSAEERSLPSNKAQGQSKAPAYLREGKSSDQPLRKTGHSAEGCPQPGAATPCSAPCSELVRPQLQRAWELRDSGDPI